MNLSDRIFTAVIHGIEKSEREGCPDEAKNVMLFALKINEEIVNYTKFYGVHRLGKSKQITGSLR